MKKLFLLSTSLFILSCSSPLDKKFDSKNYASDILEVEKKISPDEKKLIEFWVITHSIVGKDIEINGLTYNQILDNAKKDKAEKETKLKNFLNTKFTDSDKFGEDSQTIVDQGLYELSQDEMEEIGFYIGYKKREGNVLEKMTYAEIFKQAPAFYKEKNSDEE